MQLVYHKLLDKIRSNSVPHILLHCRSFTYLLKQLQGWNSNFLNTLQSNKVLFFYHKVDLSYLFLQKRKLWFCTHVSILSLILVSRHFGGVLYFGFGFRVSIGGRVRVSFFGSFRFRPRLYPTCHGVGGYESTLIYKGKSSQGCYHSRDQNKSIT